MNPCVIGEEKYTKNLYGWFANKNRKDFSRKVKCMNTGEVYMSMREAAYFAGLKSVSGICGVCNGRLEYAGKHPITKEQLVWNYFNE